MSNRQTWTISYLNFFKSIIGMVDINIRELWCDMKGCTRIKRKLVHARGSRGVLSSRALQIEMREQLVASSCFMIFLVIKLTYNVAMRILKGNGIYKRPLLVGFAWLQWEYDQYWFYLYLETLATIVECSIFIVFLYNRERSWNPILCHRFYQMIW